MIQSTRVPLVRPSLRNTRRVFFVVALSLALFSTSSVSEATPTSPDPLTTSSFATSSGPVVVSGSQERHGLNSDSSSSSLSPSPSSTWSLVPVWILVVFFLLVVYALAFAVLIFYPSSQAYLVYLHWICPPSFVAPLSDLRAHRLGEIGRHVQVGNLRGWHILPPGPPFPSSSSNDFDTRLSSPRQRVLLFLHGNSGTRAFPLKRVDFYKLFNAQFRSHVLAFDYSGFADCGNGPPSEYKLYDDAARMYSWVKSRIHPSSTFIVYGQSLGSFCATFLAEKFNDQHLTILDAAPSSLMEAATTHPAGALFRAATRTLPQLLHERLDSRARMNKVKGPLLIVHGMKDFMVHWTQGQELATRAEACGNVHTTFKLFPDVGHVDVCAADGYLNTVFAFVRAHERRRCTGPAGAKTAE